MPGVVVVVVLGGLPGAGVVVVVVDDGGVVSPQPTANMPRLRSNNKTENFFMVKTSCTREFAENRYSARDTIPHARDLFPMKMNLSGRIELQRRRLAA